MPTRTYPLSFGQEKRLLPLGRGRLPHAALQAWARISGPLDIRALARSLQEMTERHAALRVRLVETPTGTVRQVILPPGQAGITLSKKLIRCTGEDQFADYAGRLGSALIGQPWDWSTQAPAQFHLLRYAPDFHVLLAQFADLAIDGRSRGVLLRDLWASYRSTRAGAAPDAPADGPAETDLGDALNRQQLRFSRRSGTANRAYWTRRFAALASDTGSPARDERESPRAATVHETRIAAAELAAVLRNCQQESASLFQWHVMCFALTIFQATAAERVALTIPMDTRESQDLDVTGMFTIALPIVIPRSQDPATVLRSVKNELTQAMLHRHIHAHDLVEAGYGSPSDGSGYFKVRYLEHLAAPGATLADGLHLAQDSYPPPTPYQAAEGVDLIIGAFPGALDLTLAFAPEDWDRTRSTVFAEAFRARLLTAITP
ncbi:condensation domain-containing protein [Kitasatospora sp. LaBMicrA B282]|uniref:condensation domain-containing protein n=1 Tax=Kitasatospora sp. LaBMicrA B282 TaxID=3420949 RepID=UPI003D0DC05C